MCLGLVGRELSDVFMLGVSFAWAGLLSKWRKVWGFRDNWAKIKGLGGLSIG